MVMTVSCLLLFMRICLIKANFNKNTDDSFYAIKKEKRKKKKEKRKL